MEYQGKQFQIGEKNRIQNLQLEEIGQKLTHWGLNQDQKKIGKE